MAVPKIGETRTLYAARQGMMAYNSNTMDSSILIKDVGREMNRLGLKG